MSMLDWAKREIAIASRRERDNAPENESDYGCACYESALKAFESLMSDGHTGMSIGFTKVILNRLIDGKPLTPIEDTDDVWNLIGCRSTDDCKMFQNKRMSALFKNVYSNGSIKYRDIDRCACVKHEKDHVWWHNGFVSKIYDEMFPITMPYIPNDKPDEIICEEFLTDRKNGDFDTLGVLYIRKTTGEKIEINRYFKEAGNTFVEITLEEYKERIKMHNERIEKIKEECNKND